MAGSYERLRGLLLGPRVLLVDLGAVLDVFFFLLDAVRRLLGALTSLTLQWHPLSSSSSTFPLLSQAGHQALGCR